MIDSTYIGGLNDPPTIGEFEATPIFNAGSYGWLNVTCSDPNLQADISKVFVSFQVGSDTFKVAYDGTFSIATNPNNRITLSGSSTRISVNSTAYRYSFYIRIAYNATLDASVDVVSGTGVQDASLAYGNATSSGLFAFENRVGLPWSSNAESLYEFNTVSANVIINSTDYHHGSGSIQTVNGTSSVSKAINDVSTERWIFFAFKMNRFPSTSPYQEFYQFASSLANGTNCLSLGMADTGEATVAEMAVYRADYFETKWWITAAEWNLSEWHTVLLYMKSGVTDGIATLYWDGLMKINVTDANIPNPELYSFGIVNTESETGGNLFEKYDCIQISASEITVDAYAGANQEPTIGEFVASTTFYAGQYGWLNATARDLDGQEDISQVFVAFQVASETKKLRYSSGVFSEATDTNNRITLDASTSTRVSLNSTSYKYGFYLRIAWNATLDGSVDIVSGTGVQDISFGTGNATDSGLFAYENRVRVASLSVDDSRVNPSQTLSFTPRFYYYGTSTAITNLDNYISARLELAGVLKGYSSSFSGLGDAIIGSVTAPSSVESYTYNAYALPLAQNLANASQAVIVDQIKVSSYSTSDSRANINENVNIDVTLVYSYDSTIVSTLGAVTINTYSATYQGMGIYRITRTSASVTSVTYNTVTCFETLYGLTSIDQSSTLVIWDRIQVQSYTASKTSANLSENVNIDALLYYDFDNGLVTNGLASINGYSAAHQGSGVWRIIRTSATAATVTYNTVAASGNTYGITSIDQNGKSVSVSWGGGTPDPTSSKQATNLFSNIASAVFLMSIGGIALVAAVILGLLSGGGGDLNEVVMVLAMIGVGGTVVLVIAYAFMGLA